MTNPTLERAVSALKTEIGKAFDAKPLPFAGEAGNWSARGNMQELDLEVCARAVLMAVRDQGMNIYHSSDPKSHFPEYEAAEGFQDMIDAILAEGE